MINLQISGFDWDAGNKNKCQKHGVSQAEIEQLFKQDSVLISRDTHHSQKKRGFWL